MDDSYLELIIALSGLSRKAVRDVTFFGLLHACSGHGHERVVVCKPAFQMKCTRWYYSHVNLYYSMRAPIMHCAFFHTHWCSRSVGIYTSVQ